MQKNISKIRFYVWIDSANNRNLVRDEMDIEIIFKIAAIGILITVISQVLKKTDRDDIATLVSLAGFIIVLSLVLNMIGDLFTNIKQIFSLY